jgi:uncharacterized RDD family membrane protein YckC
MSTNEPPAGSTPPGEPTPPSAAPPPPPPPAATPPPASYAPPPPAAAPVQGVPRPGELLDRFLARFIDGIILGVVYGIIAGIVGGVLITGYRSGGELFLYYLIISVISSVLYLGYYAYMESSRGQTIGKIVMKLKVFGPDGVSNPTLEQAVKRNIYMAFGLAGIVPVVGTLLGGLASLGAVILIAVNINGDTVKRQHWFDHFAGGTQVMKIG